MGYTLHRFALSGRGDDHAQLLLALKRAAGGRDLDGEELLQEEPAAPHAAGELRDVRLQLEDERHRERLKDRDK